MGKNSVRAWASALEEIGLKKKEKLSSPFFVNISYNELTIICIVIAIFVALRWQVDGLLLSAQMSEVRMPLAVVVIYIACLCAGFFSPKSIWDSENTWLCWSSGNADVSILNLFSSPPLHQFFVQCKGNNQQAKVSTLNSGKFLFCFHIHCTENFGHLLVTTHCWVHWQYTCLCCIGSTQQYQFFIHLLWPGTRSIKLLKPIQPFNKPYHVKRYESQLIPKVFSVVDGYSFQKQVPCIV